MVLKKNLETIIPVSHVLFYELSAISDIEKILFDAHYENEYSRTNMSMNDVVDDIMT